MVTTHPISQGPVIFWLRRDLRLSDHPGLTKALETGQPVIPVFIRDDILCSTGAAPRWRLGLAAQHFACSLSAIEAKLIFRTGDPVQVLRALIQETGASHVMWSRAYDPASIARDKAVKAALKDDGIGVESVPGHVMFEPWTVAPKTASYYKVYTPMWKSVRDRDVPEPLPKITKWTAPETWPKSEDLTSWDLGKDMQRGAGVVRPYLAVGEDAAMERLSSFLAGPIADYATDRDLPWKPGTSRLSENFAYGEISPHTAWHDGQEALRAGKAGAEVFLKELVWREFAYHLAFHTPQIVDQNWRSEWDAFPWNEDDTTPEVTAWKQGRTGVPFVDAAMREMYVTGTMHNRGRMIVASYLTKHLMSHWQIGQRWFEECLVDWDPAANAMGWQWSAGSGPDATPYFRVFNAETQLEKFDKSGSYVAAWIAEKAAKPSQTALSYFDAIPRAWGLSPSARYPAPIVAMDVGRKRALDAYANRGF
ncbi:MAG: deoxyribodipyrimidine photo-lyase [Pseudomonadota bacterium]